MNQIEQLEQQMRQRMDALASADPLCNRIMGRIEILREIEHAQTQQESDVMTEALDE